MVSSASLNIINDDTKDYAMFVPGDETPIDIKAVVEFFDRVYSNEDVHNDIREKFVKLCDWEYTFVPVMEYLADKE